MTSGVRESRQLGRACVGDSPAGAAGVWGVLSVQTQHILRFLVTCTDPEPQELLLLTQKEARASAGHLGLGWQATPLFCRGFCFSRGMQQDSLSGCLEAASVVACRFSE